MTEPKQIKAMRIMRGWTQKDLATYLTVSPITVSNWERGKTRPAPIHRVAIAQLLIAHDERS